MSILSPGSLDFPPSNRLHFPWEYRQFFGASEVFRLSECTLFRIPNRQTSFRVGITIKARPGSVMRNKIKRAIREMFRINKDALGPYDYNVVITSARRLDHTYPRRLSRSLKNEFLARKTNSGSSD